MADNNILGARAEELYSRSEYAPAAGKFLTPAEQAEFSRFVRSMGSEARDRFFLWGGCRGTERRVPLFLPDYMIETVGAEYVSDTIAASTLPLSANADKFDEKNSATGNVFHNPCGSDIFDSARENVLLRAIDGWNHTEVCGIVPLKVNGGGFVPLSHRDYMGGLLALGLERDVVGDILPLGDADAVIFVSEMIADFVTENFNHAGRDKVTAVRTELPADFIIRREFEEVVLISASMRLDGIVHAFTSVSREDAQELITSGFTSVNYSPETRPDFRVPEGSVISVRGYGKMRIIGCRGETRSGRMRILAEKFI